MRKDSDLNIPEISQADSLTTQDYVYQRLRNAIILGTIEPGTHLTMRGLADRLGLSPTPIREAIRRLSSEHAIEVMGNRRMAIPRMTLPRFEELLELRVAVERHAAQRALPYISDIVIQTLKEIDDEMDRQVSADDLDKLTHLNCEFHRTLYTVNPHQTTLPIVESVWLQLGPFQRQVIKRVKEYYLVDHHKEILSALSTRNAAALGTAIEGDIRDGLSRSGRALLSDPSPPTKAA